MRQIRTRTTGNEAGKVGREQSVWLTPDEVAELTECSRRSTQCLRLAKMGIPFRENFAGRPLVERSAVLRHRERSERARDQPNWNAMGAV
ncbi:hypothetical protein ACVWWQ_003241 [Rhodanobacter sp. TND4EL1]|jgi:hypothetical protein